MRRRAMAAALNLGRLLASGIQQKEERLMKRAIVLVCVAAVVLLALAVGTARADPASHFKFSFSGVTTHPAGTFCDFNEQETFTVLLNGAFVPVSGLNPVEVTVHATHTNLDTGYSLTDTAHFQSLAVINSGQGLTAGIYYHLKDPSGKTVLVKAGNVTFDQTGLTSFTPNSGADQTAAQIICPALGGSPS